jgi:hypothetical protein
LSACLATLPIRQRAWRELQATRCLPAGRRVRGDELHGRGTRLMFPRTPRHLLGRLLLAA